MAVFFGILKVCGLFRVDPKDEEDGLDHSYHGGSAYGDTTGEFKPTYSKVLPSSPLFALGLLTGWCRSTAPDNASCCA